MSVFGPASVQRPLPKQGTIRLVAGTAGADRGSVAEISTPGLPQAHTAAHGRRVEGRQEAGATHPARVWAAGEAMAAPTAAARPFRWPLAAGENGCRHPHSRRPLCVGISSTSNSSALPRVMSVKRLNRTEVESSGRIRIDSACYSRIKIVPDTFPDSWAFFRPKSHISNNLEMEARVGIEPTHTAFAEPCLTTWLPRR
jgi:hypothetical protein